ncbi:MAG: rsbP 1 [Chthoniobacteraceae bacterium]|nr:rsbP 1 [Chthoniobacteraceae bacterium]
MSPNLYRRVSFGCALLTAILGTLTLISWVAGLEALAGLRRNYIPMAPSTALGFSILGCIMLVPASTSPRQVVSRALIAFVALVAVGKLFEFFGGPSLGWEEWLVSDPAMFGAVQKGRMSPITAFNFLLICSAIFALAGSRWRAWAGPAAILTMGISFVVVLGYMYGTPLLYGGHVIPVALPTAAAFFALGGSVVAGAGPGSWPLKALLGDSTRAQLLRWFLPTVIAVALGDGFVRTRFLTGTELNPALSSALSTLLSTIVVAAVIYQVAELVGGRIDRAERERNVARKALESLNEELEKRIADRTLELRTKNEQMQEELTMARELQFALLPQNFPTVPHSVAPQESALRFFSLYFPTGGVSGDFFDVFPVSDSSIGIFICDVMGHGVRAALITSMMRVLLEQHSGSDPGKLLTEMNRGLHSILKNTGTTLYATAFMMIADVARSELCFASAGHPKPVHVRRRIGETVSLAPAGRSSPALGLFPEATYATGRSPMAPGDMIMLFTDGLFEVEAPDAQLYSQEALLEAIRNRSTLPTHQILEGVLREIRDFAQRPDFDDDVCVIGMEVCGNSAHRG